MRVSKHRGSSISAASKDEIKEVEEATKILEEPEEEEKHAEPEANKGVGFKELSKSSEPHVKFTGETQGEEIDRVKAELQRDANDSDAQETGAPKSEANVASKKALEIHQDLPDPQKQNAAEAAEAPESVVD